MTTKVDVVLDAMRMTTRDNVGVIIEPLETIDGVLRIRYFQGTNQECPQCVMSPSAFRDMVKALCKVQAPHILDVEVLPVE